MIQRAYLILILIVFCFIMAATAFAKPGKPNFSPAIYADGEVWGTKGTADLPPPNEHNLQSFDKLFMFTGDAAPGQLPVAEAAPGNPYYNGGRWFTHVVSWTQEGIDAYDTLPVLMSYDDIMLQYDLGYLNIAPGSPGGGPATYFQCPLLPVK
jgi:hypothetical protein